MFNKRPDATGVAQPNGASHKPVKQNTAIDLLAVVAGTATGALGAAQIFVPIIAYPLTGLESGLASQIVGLQWLVIAGLLLLGGILRVRVVTIFAAEFLTIGAGVALTVVLFNDPKSVAVIVHAAMALMAFACSGFARLTDKADLKKELRFEQERAKLAQSSPDIIRKDLV